MNKDRINHLAEQSYWYFDLLCSKDRIPVLSKRDAYKQALKCFLMQLNNEKVDTKNGYIDPIFGFIAKNEPRDMG